VQHLLNTITTGDARELSASIPDASVDLIFTDPVYERIEDYTWLAETAARVLKPDRACLVWIATPQLENIMAAMAGHGLTYRWQLIHYKPGRVKQKFGAAGYCKYEILLWYDKGRLPQRRWMDVFQSMPFQSKLVMDLSHEWAKDPDALAAVVEHFSKPRWLVYDPFTGGGTVPAVCKILHRDYIASEIDGAKAERARARVAATQAMHPVFLEEQTAFEVAA
jgi:adenine-specific DNA-methyltransferase